ncbi:hypothetical protein M9H77_26383 [Catharanthus roseus]|uniref:Uncharacterized protein n=1 Tax=Catharanthus roseus TaxID=4058 RepID=A0ACC0ABC7_CATRO|nr:hypothetical protein M9H77_26383 [Catharanthus roseus]
MLHFSLIWHCLLCGRFVSSALRYLRLLAFVCWVGKPDHVEAESSCPPWQRYFPNSEAAPLASARVTSSIVERPFLAGESPLPLEALAEWGLSTRGLARLDHEVASAPQPKAPPYAPLLKEGRRPKD